MFLMGLCVLSELEMAVVFVIYLLAHQNGVWTKVLGCPPITGNAFNKNMVVLAISITSRAGIFWKGNVFYMAHICSFTVHIYCLMSPTCSSLDDSLSLRASSARPLRKGMNSPSMSAVGTLNLAFWYKETTTLMHFSSVAFFWSATASIIPNLMFRDNVTNKGTLFTYMRSTHKVTSP